MNNLPVKYTLLQKLYFYIHRTLYANRLNRQIRFPDRYIISIGNLSAGGTGKTPVTAFLAEKFMKKKPLAVLRGYKGKAKNSALVSDGKKIYLDYRDAGDEAILLSRISGLRVAVSKDRAEAVKKFSKKDQIILLDDAFQNPRVYRDHDLVLIDATIPPEKVQIFPVGHFRDDLTSLSRADTILLTRSDLVSSEELKRWRKIIESHADKINIYESIHKPGGIFPPLKKSKVGVFCGIGNPESFFSTVRSLGYQIERSFAWPDHHVFNSRDIEFLKLWNLPLLTTEKDGVRLEQFRSGENQAEFNYHVLKIKIKIKNEKDFLKRILQGKMKK